MKEEHNWPFIWGKGVPGAQYTIEIHRYLRYLLQTNGEPLPAPDLQKLVSEGNAYSVSTKDIGAIDVVLNGERLVEHCESIYADMSGFGEWSEYLPPGKPAIDDAPGLAPTYKSIRSIINGINEESKLLRKHLYNVELRIADYKFKAIHMANAANREVYSEMTLALEDRKAMYERIIAENEVKIEKYNEQLTRSTK